MAEEGGAGGPAGARAAGSPGLSFLPWHSLASLGPSSCRISGHNFSLHQPGASWFGIAGPFCGGVFNLWPASNWWSAGGRNSRAIIGTVNSLIHFLQRKLPAFLCRHGSGNE